MKKRAFEHCFFGERRVVFDNASISSSEIQSQINLHKEEGGDIRKLKQEVKKKMAKDNFRPNQEIVSGNVYVGINIDEKLEPIFQSYQRSFESKIGTPSQNNHYRKVLEWTARRYATSSQNFRGSAAIDTDDLMGGVDDLRLADNSAVQDSQKNEMMSPENRLKEKTRKLEEYKSYQTNIESDISQAWNGLYQDKEHGQVREPLSESKSSFSIPSHSRLDWVMNWKIDQILSTISNLQTKSEVSFPQKDQTMYFLNLLLQRQYVLSFSQTLKNTDLNNQNALKASLSQIQKTMGDREIIKKKMEVDISFLEKKFPKTEANEKSLEKKQEELSRQKEYLSYLNDQFLFFNQFSTSSSIRSDIGYQPDGEQSKDKESKLYKSLDKMTDTYVLAYKELSPHVADNKEALNVFLELCIFENISVNELKTFLINLKTYTHDQFGGLKDTIQFADVMTSVKMLYSGAFSNTMKNEKALNAIEPKNLWNKISMILRSKSSQERALQGDGVVDTKLSLNSTKAYEQSTKISDPVGFYRKWNELANKVGDKYIKFQLSNWFKGDSNTGTSIADENAMKEMLMQILPETGLYSKATFLAEGFNDKWKAFLHQTHDFFTQQNSASLIVGDVQKQAEKKISGLSIGSAKDFLEDRIDDITSGDTTTMLSSALFFMFAYKFYKNEFGGNIINAGVALWVANEVTGGAVEHYGGLAYTSIIGESPEEARNLANMIVNRNKYDGNFKCLEEKNIPYDESLMRKSGNALGKYPTDSVLDWYANVKARKAMVHRTEKQDPYCEDIMPKEGKDKSFASEISRLIPFGDKTKNKKEEVVDSAILFLDMFFANVAIDRQKDKTGKGVNSIEALEDLAQVGRGAVKSLHYGKKEKMIDVYDAEVTKEQKEAALQRSLDAYKELGKFLGNTQQDVTIFLRKNGIDPLSDLKDFWSTVKTKGFTVLSAVKNEFVLKDRANHVWKLTKAGATWVWKEGEKGVSPVYQSAKEGFAWMENKINSTGVYFSEIIKSWNTLFSTNLFIGELKNPAILNNNKEVDVWAEVEAIGLKDPIKKTYGIDSDYDLKYFLNHNAIQETLKKIASLRSDSKTVKGITHQDVVTYFISGIYGAGGVAQASVDAVETTSSGMSQYGPHVGATVAGATAAALMPGGVAALGGAIAGGAIGAVAIESSEIGDDLKRLFASYSPERGFRGNIAQYINGNESFRTYIKTTSNGAIVSAGQLASKSEMIFTSETFQREANYAVRNILNTAKNKNRIGRRFDNGWLEEFISKYIGNNPPGTTVSNALFFAQNSLERKMADGAEREKMLIDLRTHNFKNWKNQNYPNGINPSLQKKPDAFFKGIEQYLFGYEHAINSPDSTNVISTVEFKAYMEFLVAKELREYDYAIREKEVSTTATGYRPPPSGEKGFFENVGDYIAGDSNFSRTQEIAHDLDNNKTAPDIRNRTQ